MPEEPTFHGSAQIKLAPGNKFDALRIDRRLSYVTLPGIDISPAKMGDCTLILSVYLENIPVSSKGWIINCDNGGFDRAIALHDDRFKGIGLGVGYVDAIFWEDGEKVPDVGKWFQISAVFRQGGACNIYYNNEKAPLCKTGKNQNNAMKCLRIGTQPEAEGKGGIDHYVDGWIKGVKVFDRALEDDEIKDLNNDFQDEIKVRRCSGNF